MTPLAGANGVFLFQFTIHPLDISGILCYNDVLLNIKIKRKEVEVMFSILGKGVDAYMAWEQAIKQGGEPYMKAFTGWVEKAMAHTIGLLKVTIDQLKEGVTNLSGKHEALRTDHQNLCTSVARIENTFNATAELERDRAKWAEQSLQEKVTALEEENRRLREELRQHGEKTAKDLAEIAFMVGGIQMSITPGPVAPPVDTPEPGGEIVVPPKEEKPPEAASEAPPAATPPMSPPPIPPPPPPAPKSPAATTTAGPSPVRPELNGRSEKEIRGLVNTVYIILRVRPTKELRQQAVDKFREATLSDEPLFREMAKFVGTTDTRIRLINKAGVTDEQGEVRPAVYHEADRLAGMVFWTHRINFEDAAAALKRFADEEKSIGPDADKLLQTIGMTPASEGTDEKTELAEAAEASAELPPPEPQEPPAPPATEPVAAEGASQ